MVLALKIYRKASFAVDYLLWCGWWRGQIRLLYFSITSLVSSICSPYGCVPNEQNEECKSHKSSAKEQEQRRKRKVTRRGTDEDGDIRRVIDDSGKI